MDSILEGQVLDGSAQEQQPQDTTTTTNSPLPPQPQHRRHRSRGGGGTGHHSRSESLVESLADLVEVLQTIDEVQVERPGAADEGGTLLVEEGDHENATGPATVTAIAPPALLSSSSEPPTTTRHRRGPSRGGGGTTTSSSSSNSRRQHQHSRTGSLVLDGLLDEVLDVRDALVEELGHADDGQKEFCFLDMSLAREMSILPEDVVRVAGVTAPEAIEAAAAVLEHKEGTATKSEFILPEDPEKRPLLLGDTATTTVLPPPSPAISLPIPLNAYLLLASAVVALSSVGPLLNVQTGIHPVLKVYWRMSATALCLLPFAASSVMRDGGLRMATQALKGPQWMTLLVTASCYATMCVAFVLALQYTAVGNAVILSNSQSILLLIGKIFVGHRILALEAGGALLAFGGAALCSIDSAGREQEASEGNTTTSSSSSQHTTLLGDGLALLSATGGVLYLTFAKVVRPNLNLYLFMFLVMFCGSTLILLCMLFYSVLSDTTTTNTTNDDYHLHGGNNNHFHITIDRNIVTGIWGWMNGRIDRLPLELTMVVLCNLLGAMGYVRAMQYFDNLIIAVATLLEPVMATLTAVLLRVGLLPGTLGWIGNAMVALGTFAVVYPSASSSKGSGSGGGH